jgi:fucose 4-O-acetylase-like acetyltransferase
LAWWHSSLLANTLALLRPFLKLLLLLLCLLILHLILQSWFMGLMFLLSGFFSGPSYERKGAARFLADRTLRLLLPLLVYDCVLQPLAFEIARHSANAPAGLREAANGFAYYYATQFTRLGHGAAWFIAVLFVFDLVYAAVRVAADGWSAVLLSCSTAQRSNGLGQAAASDEAGSNSAALKQLAGDLGGLTESPAGQQQQQPCYSCAATACGAAAIAAVIAGLTLLVRVGVLIPLGLPISLWVVQFIQFQPAYLPQYVVAFVLGLAARKCDALRRLPNSAGAAAAAAAFALAGAGAVIMTVMPGSNFGHELEWGPSTAYVSVYAVWEQCYAVCMWMAMLVGFRQLVNRKGGALGAAVTGAAYAVYLVHVPVLSAFGLAVGELTWHPAAQCVLATLLTVVGSWVVGLLLRLIPGMKRVL